MQQCHDDGRLSTLLCSSIWWTNPKFSNCAPWSTTRGWNQIPPSTIQSVTIWRHHSIHCIVFWQTGSPIHHTQSRHHWCLLHYSRTIRWYERPIAKSDSSLITIMRPHIFDWSMSTNTEWFPSRSSFHGTIPDGYNGPTWPLLWDNSKFPSSFQALDTWRFHYPSRHLSWEIVIGWRYNRFASISYTSTKTRQLRQTWKERMVCHGCQGRRQLWVLCFIPCPRKCWH